MEEKIVKIKALKKDTSDFMWSQERADYNKAIDDVLEILEGKKYFKTIQTGPK